jgi:Ca2+-dependent lipid-binding protein
VRRVDANETPSTAYLTYPSRSTVQVNTLSPVWNELWRVKNVPTTAKLNVEVLDKDDGQTDDFIGRFHCDVSAGAKELEIESSLLKRTKGSFWLKVRLRSLTVRWVV